MSKGQIKSINSKKEYEELVSGSQNRLIVIDFSAEWCAPCRLIDRVYERMAKEYQTVTFATVDVEAHEEIAEEEGVTAMPFFKFYKHGKMIAQVTGASKEQLREKIELHQ